MLRQLAPQLGQRKTDVMIDNLVEQVAINFRKWRDSHSNVSPNEFSDPMINQVCRVVANVTTGPSSTRHLHIADSKERSPEGLTL
jgi:hypothetical protein